jgi:hypothetical protein
MGFFGGGGSAASNMVGATSSAAGTAGLVPAPAAGDEEAFLCGDATFKKDFFVMAPNPFTKSSTRYYLPFLLVGRPETTNTANFSKTAGALLSPFCIRGSATISSISFILTTANANTDYEIGVYQADFLTGWPLTKIAQATTINTSSTATNTAVTTNITAAVRGMFWCFIYNKTTTTSSVAASSANNDGLSFLNGITGADNIGSTQRRRFVVKDSSISSGVLPTTLSTSDIDNTTTASPPPSLWVTY